MSVTRQAPPVAGNAVEVRPMRDALRVRATGIGSLDATIACWTRIVAEGGERRPSAVLVIDEMTGPPLSADDWKTLVERLSGHGLEGLRIAHVKPHGLEAIEYCEIYAREAGFNARVFDQEATATRWLRYGSQQDTP